MGGLQEYLVTNFTDAAGAFISSEFDTHLQAALQHANMDSVVAFVAPVAAKAISGFATSATGWQVNVGPEYKKFGVKVDAFVSATYGATIPCYIKKDWNDFSANRYGMGGSVFTVDMSHVRLRPLRTTKLLTNRQANDADEITEEFLTEVTFEMHQEKKHGQIYGITS